MGVPFSPFLAPWEGLGAGFWGPGASFWAPVAPSGTRFGVSVRTRGNTVTLLGDIFDALEASAPTKCLKSGPLKKQQKSIGKIQNSIVFWKVGHAIRPRLCSPNTLFTFLCFCPKQQPNDLKTVPKIDTNPSKSDAGAPWNRFLRGPENRRFWGEGRHALTITIPEPGAQPAAPHFAKKDTNYIY